MKCLLCGKNIQPFHTFENKAVFTKPLLKKHLGKTIDVQLGYCNECRHISSNASQLDGWGEIEDTMYRDLYKNFPPSTLSKIEEAYFEFLFKLLSGVVPSGKVLEIGCHDGYFLNRFKQAGYSCFGIEPSPASLVAREKYGLNVTQDFFSEKSFKNETFDLIVARHVIEHVPDPAGFTKNISRIVAKNGHVYIEVPNSYITLREAFFPEFHIEHLSHFTQPSLEKLMSASGIKIKHLESTWAYSQFPFFQLLGQKSEEAGESKNKHYFLDNSVSRVLENFKKSYDRYLSNLKRITKGKKIAIWGAGSFGVQIAIDLGANEKDVVVVDPSKGNQGMFLPVTGYEVMDPSILETSDVDAIIIATGWEEEVLNNQLPKYLRRGVQIIKFSNLLHS